MCGIIGFLGKRPAKEILLEGLKRLEYRGYDSSGLAILSDNNLQIFRSKGKVFQLERLMGNQPISGTLGIGHTRWATHGKPSDENAHPHRSENFVVVHNGIIENHLEIRGKLVEEGYRFQSETDTEVIPYLMESFFRKGNSVEEAIQKALAQLKGSFALAILSSLEPLKLFAAKRNSPLVLGLGKKEYLVASDIPALLDHTKTVVILEDGDLAVLEPRGYRIKDFLGFPRERKSKEITWSRRMAEKEGFKHFMLKEIFEQPEVIADTLRGRIFETQDEIVLDEVSIPNLENITRVVMVACGTSWHAALVGKFWMEEWARIPVEVDMASEFRLRHPLVNSQTLFIAISQSGETADTLAALEIAKAHGSYVLSICNVVDSSMARKSDGVLYTRAGPEIGVASTKSFTTQLCGLALLTLFLAKHRNAINAFQFRDFVRSLLSLPSMVKQVLSGQEKILRLAEEWVHAQHFLFLGRGSSYPIALEGALKLKEISYIHAEGYSGGEMKHGPIALIDENLPIVALVSGGPTYEKMIGNICEAKARGGRVIVVVSEKDIQASSLSEDKMEIPLVQDLIRPMVEVIPLQLLAYHIADRLGKDVDQPRNLAKSVTVE